MQALMLGGEVEPELYALGPAPRSKGEVVRFYWHTVKDEKRSAEEGRQCYMKAEYVEILVPGDKTLAVQTPVTDKHRQKYPHHYAAFLAGEKEQLVGTPLEKWPGVDAPQVEELKYLKVRTVEQLAAISDTALTQLGPGGRALRDQAKAWLEAAQGLAPLAKMQAQLDTKTHQLAALESQVAELTKALETQMKKAR